MKVEQSEYFQSLLQSKQTTQPKTDDFYAELERQTINTIKTQYDAKNPQEESTNPAAEAFRQELTSMGAVAFFYNFNMEKIEELIEEKKQELKASLGLDEGANPPLEGQERAQALAHLEQMLESYTKQLREQMEAKSVLEGKKSPLDLLISS